MIIKKQSIIIIFAGIFVLILFPGIMALGYTENFDSSSSLNSWTISDSFDFYQTTFEGDGVLRFDTRSEAFLPLVYSGEPFKLEWDSRLELIPDEINRFRFGLYHNELPFESCVYLRGNYESDLTDDNYWNDYSISFTRLGAGGGGSGWMTENFFDKWFHNILYFNFPSGDDVLTQYEIYEGKGNTANLYKVITQSSSAPFDASKLSKLGFSVNPPTALFGMNNNARGYIDNLEFEVIIPDEDNDGIPNDEDKCPNTQEEQIVYGCSCEQILDLKPGKDKSLRCSSGIIKVFTEGIGWAKL